MLEGLARAALAADRSGVSAAVEVLWAEAERNLPLLMARAPARLAQVLRTIAASGEDVISSDHLVWRFVGEALALDGNERYTAELVG